MNLFLDMTCIYLVSGVCVIAFLYFEDLFYFSQIAGERPNATEVQIIADKALALCINIGLATTSVLVWPLLLFTCLNSYSDQDLDD